MRCPSNVSVLKPKKKKKKKKKSYKASYKVHMHWTVAGKMSHCTRQEHTCH